MSRNSGSVRETAGKIGLLIVLGAGIGTVVGAALGNVTIGVAVGAALGVAGGAVVELTQRRKKNDS